MLYIGECEYGYNYAKLLGKIKEVYGTQEKFAEALGIGRVSLSQRLNGKLEFSRKEINRSMELLNLEPADVSLYFFQVIEKKELGRQYYYKVHNRRKREK